MADPAEPMGRATKIGLLFYLLLTSALSFYLVYGLWEAAPPTIAESPAEEPDLTGQQGPEDASPQIVQIDPERVSIGAGRATVRVFGHNFGAESRVRFDGVPRLPAYISPNQLVVTLVASDFSAPGPIVLSVVNGDQTSNAMPLLVQWPGEALGVWDITVWPGWIEWQTRISAEVRLLLLVVFIGAFGAAVIALQSLSDYSGERKLINSWTIFYVVRPPLGGGVALVFYLVIRGGFMAGTEVDVGATTPFGIIAVAALVGMFSDKAILKLNELFVNLFKADDAREEKLGELAIEPTSLPNGTVGTTYPGTTLRAAGGEPPYKWSVAPPLPAGLTIDASTGELSGTPTAAAAKAPYTFTVQDKKGDTAELALTFEVA